MNKSADTKLRSSVELLGECILALRDKKEDPILFAAVSKAYEVAFEYAWKNLKRRADEAGLEVYSPRDALRAGAQLGILENISEWEDYLNARNLSVHDYIGITDKEFLPLIKSFSEAVKVLC